MSKNQLTELKREYSDLWHLHEQAKRTIATLEGDRDKLGDKVAAQQTAIDNLTKLHESERSEANKLRSMLVEANRRIDSVPTVGRDTEAGIAPS